MESSVNNVSDESSSSILDAPLGMYLCVCVFVCVCSDLMSLLIFMDKHETLAHIDVKFCNL